MITINAIIFEGYAKVQNDHVYYDYNGPIRLFEKAGFAEAARYDNRVVMRIELEELRKCQ